MRRGPGVSMDNLIHADCLDAMAAMDAESIDAIVTDPPYGLEFMGKGWDGADGFRRSFNPADVSRDNVFGRSSARGPEYRASPIYQQWCEAWAREAFRIAKPGAHLLAFGGTRTVHRLAAAIEDAGWEIRDMLVWGYASGFPKSLDVSKAIDKAAPRNGMFEAFAAHYAERRRASGLSHADVCAAADAHGAVNHGGASTNWERGYGVPTLAHWAILAPLLGLSDEWMPLIERVEAEREKIGERDGIVRPGFAGDQYGPAGGGQSVVVDITAPATPDAEKWNGWGTALKPAWEPIVMARKPLRGTVAANVLRHGTGALNIDGTRIGATPDLLAKNPHTRSISNGFGEERAGADYNPTLGRWPANVILTDPIFDGGIDGVVGGGETTSGVYVPPTARARNNGIGLGMETTREGVSEAPDQYGDSGTYSRFFLIPKSARSEREPVLGGLADQHVKSYSGAEISGRSLVDGEWTNTDNGRKARQNVHPTVKPLDLMRHLVRLVTPPGGVVLDPFLGSGTTALAAEMEGFAWIGIEKEAEYVAIAEARLNGTQRGFGLDVGAPVPKMPNTHPDLSKHQPKRRAPSESYSGGWPGLVPDEETA
jgi:DNA modification methylase